MSDVVSDACARGQPEGGGNRFPIEKRNDDRRIRTARLGERQVLPYFTAAAVTTNKKLFGKR